MNLPQKGPAKFDESDIDDSQLIVPTKSQESNDLKKRLFDALTQKLKLKRGMTQKTVTEAEEREIYNYKMVTDLFDYKELQQKENFAFKRYKDSLYRGEVVENKRQGLGICVYEIGRIYEGSWDLDKRHGKGYEKFSNGNQYLGDYDHGRVHGKGVYTWVNGDQYDGEWVNGIKHGYGVWKG